MLEEEALSDAHTRNAEGLSGSAGFFVLGDLAYLERLHNDDPYITESVRLPGRGRSQR